MIMSMMPTAEPFRAPAGTILTEFPPSNAPVEVALVVIVIPVVVFTSEPASKLVAGLEAQSRLVALAFSAENKNSASKRPGSNRTKPEAEANL